MATRLFRCGLDEVSDEMRRAVKAVTYAQLYGASARTTAQQHGLAEADVRRVAEQFARAYPRVQAYLAQVVRDCRKRGYVETLAGRRRYLPEIRAAEPKRAAAARRQAINSTVQGSAADLIKQAMLRLDARLTPAHGPALHRAGSGRLLLQIHDELIFEVEEAKAAQLQARVRNAMQDASWLHDAETLRVPLRVQLKQGKSWGELKVLEELETMTQVQ